MKMGFIMEFAENLVMKLKEDPKERDRKFREHVYAVENYEITAIFEPIGVMFSFFCKQNH